MRWDAGFRLVYDCITGWGSLNLRSRCCNTSARGMRRKQPHALQVVRCMLHATAQTMAPHDADVSICRLSQVEALLQQSMDLDAVNPQPLQVRSGYATAVVGNLPSQSSFISRTRRLDAIRQQQIACLLPKQIQQAWS